MEPSKGAAQGFGIESTLQPDMCLTEEAGMADAAHGVVCDEHEPVGGVEGLSEGGRGGGNKVDSRIRHSICGGNRQDLRPLSAHQQGRWGQSTSTGGAVQHGSPPGGIYPSPERKRAGTMPNNLLK